MSGMTNSVTMGGPNLLPDWVRALWITAYVVILIIHLYHAATMGGEHRAWHSVHILMALGMIWMFLPTPPAIIPALAWQLAFALAALLIVVWFIWSFSRRRAVNFVWVTSLIAVLAMIYMFALPGAAIPLLTYVLVAYFVAEAIAWFIGAFDEVETGRRRLLPYAVGPRSDYASKFAHPLTEAGSLNVRVTLGIMALGMAYMFLAMQIAL